MNRLIGKRGASALAAVVVLGLGGSTGAAAQVAQTGKRIPIVQAVVTTVAPVATPVVAAPAPVPAPTPLSLEALVDANSVGPALDEQGQCLATAVYFESMGEPLEGQLAVANVVINRANSGQYPTSWCGVVKQKAQFSFVRHGHFPRIDAACEAWRKAQAIARIASQDIREALPDDVLWYHADYVSPSWGHRLTRVEKIGAHIFYRA